MNGLNEVNLLGNLGADPELRVTQGGQAILKLRLATSESYLDKSNVRQERTEWHQVTVWGKRAEALAKILSKGSTIFVKGSLRTSSYEKDGEKRYRTDIQANDIILTGSRPGGTRPEAKVGRGYSSPDAQAAAQNFHSADGGDFAAGFASDDDIPF